MKTIAFFFFLLIIPGIATSAQEARFQIGQRAQLGLPPAATFTVTRTSDTNDGVCDSDCSLREAITAANNSATDDTINFDPTVFAGAQTITLTLGQLAIANNGSLTINGTGANLLTISGNNASRIFNIATGANTTIGGVRIAGGNAIGSGGGIFNLGNLNLTNSTVSGNSSSANTGGGIYNIGTLNLTNSTVSGNSAINGGGIMNFGTANVTNSTVSGNSAGNLGGGVSNGGTLNLTNSTFSGNSTSNTGSGGGVFNDDGTMNVTNSTVSGNSASNGGGITNNRGTFRARNTVISGNSIPNLFGSIAVSANNLIGVNALLAPLGDNGGQTQTHALLAGSPAINAGNNCVVTQTCATFNAPVPVTGDQRGRLRESNVDIGAFELANLTVTKNADTNDGVCDADCSLREAITAAVSGDTIQFASPLFDTPQTIQTNGQLVINKTLIINGRGANLTTVQNIAPQSSTSRVFRVDVTGNLTLSHVTVTGGNTSLSNPGGGILNRGLLTLIGCHVSGNNTASGGGGIAAGALGSLDTPTTLLVNSTIIGNVANFGGGVFINRGNTTMINITISGNQTTSSSGGGLSNSAGTTNIVNSTITANASAGFAGGVAVEASTVVLRNSIIAQNTAAAGRPELSVASTGAIVSNGNNLIGNSTDTANPITWQSSDILNQVPLLAPLGYYGGPTMTHASLSGSAAINGGNNCVTNQTCATFNPSSPLTTDQRGATRVGNVDIGAFEANSSANGGSYRATLPNGHVGSPYNFTLVPSNGSTTYAVTGGALPPGMNLTTAFAPNAVVSVTGTPTNTGVFEFSVTATNGSNTSVTDYSIDVLVPTAAGVSVSGRVLTADGRGLRNATVILTDASGISRNVRTSSFGYFRFDDVEAGQTYVVSVNSKRFNFAPQVVFVGDEVVNLEFVGDL